MLLEIEAEAIVPDGNIEMAEAGIRAGLRHLTFFE